MNILLATKLMDVGGIERSIVSLARELDRRGHRVVVTSQGGYLVKELAALGIAHYALPMSLTSPVAVWQSVRRLGALIRRERIDLVHSFAATASVSLYFALTRRPGPLQRSRPPVRFVSSPMGLQNSPRELGLVTHLRNWLLTLGAETILVISPEIERYLYMVGAPRERLLDFNFVGLELEQFEVGRAEAQAVRQELGIQPHERVVTTIGALHPRKSHELFIEAARLVVERLPDTRFLIVGEGELRQELETLARQQPTNGRIIFTGRRDDVPRLLAATDVYVKPGVVEGFIGITVLEAMALGKPVVAFDTQDVRQAVQDGVTGLIVPRNETRALARAIVALLNDAPRGQALGARGRALVEERYNFSRLVERLEQLYCSLVATR